MNSLEKILFVVGDRRPTSGAVAQATNIASRSGAHLTVVKVLEDGPNVVDLMRETCQRELDDLVGPMRAAGVDVECRVLTGPYIEAIQGELDRGGCDLILKPGCAPSSESAVDGLDTHLIRECAVPVWILRGEADRRIARVLAAIEPESASSVKRALNLSVLQTAAGVSALCSAKLWTVSFSPAPGLRRFGQAGIVRTTNPDAEQPSPSAVEAPFSADAVETIASAAEREDVDLVVVGTVGRKGLRGLFFGNTAERLLARCDRSLLVVRLPASDTEHRQAA